MLNESLNSVINKNKNINPNMYENAFMINDDLKKSLDFTTKPPMDFKFIGGLVCISLLQAFVYQFRSANPVAIGTECYLSLGIYNEY